jgi:hypothetical protein
MASNVQASVNPVRENDIGPFRFLANPCLFYRPA